MGVLRSKLFTEGNAATLKKLEDCATGYPNEGTSHFMRGHPNGRGDHILKVQQALKNIQQTRPEMGIPDFEINGIYDERFAKAIYVYKQKKDIRNYAGKIDDIIGIKTIRSLDSDNTNRPHEDPAPKPKTPDEFKRHLPNCVPAAECPTSRKFEITMLAGASGGEGFDVGKYWFTIRDMTNGLSALYMFHGYGAGISVTPVAVADGGRAPTSFDTDADVRVTNFGPTAGMFGITGDRIVRDPRVDSSVTYLTTQYRPDGSTVGKRTPLLKIDSGKVEIPGTNINGAHFELFSLCGKGGGARRRPITREDVIGL